MKKIAIILVALMAGILAAHAVTFNVKVPDGTRKCYVCGDFNNWNVDTAPELQPNGTNMFTLTLDNVSDVSAGFKYLCGRSWDYVEKDANGGEISNRTSLGNPDVVGSWYHVPDYNVESAEVTVNGVKRIVKVYLPEGYENSSESYPVIYYNTVQQRFNDAGSDSDAGDDFFAANSWNAPATMESLRATGGKAYIMVQVCSFLAENTPESNPAFIGTGAAATWLEAFINEVMPYVTNKYRVSAGAENTTIVGADYGGLFSLYASLSRPDVFGNCVSMSPMLWINPGALDSRLSDATAAQKYYLSAGGLEPAWMRTDVAAFQQALSAAGANAYYTEYAGKIHTDDAWGACFGSILAAIGSNSAPAAAAAGRHEAASNDMENRVYTLYGGTNQNSLQPVGTFTYAPEYYNGKNAQEAVPALVISTVIPANIKTTYYWNIAKGADSSAGWLLSSPKNVGFSSKKNADSWFNVAVFADESTANVAAHSNAFTVQVGSNKTSMSYTHDFCVEATVSFPTTDKNFTIHYGSVNSASDMGAITKTYAVSSECTEAVITYDFNLNTVTIAESGSGTSDPEVEFQDKVYTLYGGETQGSLAKIGSLVYTEDFRKKGTDTPVKAFVITADIAASIQGTYYYNVAKGADSSAGWLFSTDKNLGFSNKKTDVSWLNVAVFEDGEAATNGAGSKAFRIITSSTTDFMQPASGHTSTATAKFPGSDKTFQINFGSVNTGSDMGAMTPQISVSENCIEAKVDYDFNLNKVTVTETKFGQSLEDVTITTFTAVPSVCNAGAPVEVSLELSRECGVTLNCKRNFSENITLSLQKISDTSYKVNIANTSEGIYTFTLGLSLGNNTMSDAAEINVRVLPAGETAQKKLTVNAYENVDWDTAGRYKANFHTHTSQSFDTQYPTTQVVDKYQQAGYKILALTDHDANSYPWDMFSLYNPNAADRDPEAMGMLTMPGIELSKDRRNNWSESTGGEYNHHNDFFTGRKGQEFMSLRESYAYTNAIGGLQIINHPGQYWNLGTSYKAGEKNSPEWHAENFRLYPSLIGLEVYNQGNRRPNDRILWDQVLSINMPDRPVWGYSCDDTHTAEQYFRNYQFMLMNKLDTDNLKEAMRNGQTVFSYEHTGSGQDLAPHIKSINVDNDNQTISIDSDDADKIEWISSTHRTNQASPSTTKSTVVGIGKTFPFKDFQGSYVRARLINSKGETATQPFGFSDSNHTTMINDCNAADTYLKVTYDETTRTVTATCSEPMQRISLVNVAGTIVRYIECDGQNRITIPCSALAQGMYVIVCATDHAAYTAKFYNR